MEELGEEMIDHITQTLRDDQVRKSGPAFDAKVMASIRWRERPSRARVVVDWLFKPRSVVLSPLSGLVIAGAVAGIAYFGAGAATRSMLDSGQRAAVAEAAGLSANQPTAQLVQFVLVAADAKSVSLVGDFNDWNARATPLSSVSGNLWTVQIALAPGRYNYVFMVDGTRMVPDPSAPKAPADEFGQPNSVVTVGNSTS